MKGLFDWFDWTAMGMACFGVILFVMLVLEKCYGM